ncbi:uncharacterized protein LOC133745663 isoform X2 [Rosa rugosa]|uniref:uncharacterized protein LOC133724613 isoform X2 n=1 Tax=Rosa rugosa TaxID=74645 RepID=UPI002B414016|nr:uncharacterized protein LOC133724613 isoform X2 [Rosa rugosa]XP_062029754.1 uncharacterized protein LOC133745663 isoform X2 [Rosa rugosa]
MGQMATHHNTTIYIPVSPLCLSPFYSPLRTKDNRKNHEQRIINNTTASSMFQLNLILYSLHCRDFICSWTLYLQGIHRIYTNLATQTALFPNNLLQKSSPEAA